MPAILFELDILKSFKTVKKGDRVVVGYAMTSDLDSDQTIISQSAMEEAQYDLLKYSTVLFNHDRDRPIGKVISTTVDDIGLLVKIVLSHEEDDIWTKIKEGIINKFSIKGRALDSEEVIGLNNTKILLIKKLELYETSLVTIPANVEAKTISWYVAKSLQEEDMAKKQKDDEKILEIKKEEKIEESEEETKKEESQVGGPATGDIEIEKCLTGQDLINQIKSILTKDDHTDMMVAIQSLLNALIADQKSKNEDMSLMSRLKILASKSDSDDKLIIGEAIGVLSRMNYGQTDQQKQFDFTDASETRPIYQLNIEGSLDLTDEANKFRKQILKLGKWYHWNAEGGVLNVTKEILEKLIKNFKEKVLDHVSIPLTHSQNPALNTGDVVDMIQTEDGLDVVCEIKDESVAEKIKNGLIKSISASIDPNYLDKESGQLIGPVLLHAALVQEPYIKGMREFVQLSDEFTGRLILQFEDTEPTVVENLQILKNAFMRLEKQIIEKDTDGMTEIERSAYTDCVGKKMKAGKPMAEAAKMCKDEIKKSSEETPEEIEPKTPEKVEGPVESEVVEEAKQEKVELAEAEGVYEKYLKAGKVVPAQKEALMKILSSKGMIELGDSKVDIKEALSTFLEASPQVVNFSEEGTSETKETQIPPVTPESKEEMPVEVKEFYIGKMELSEEEAMQAWKEARDRHLAEEKKSTIF